MTDLTIDVGTQITPQEVNNVSIVQLSGQQLCDNYVGFNDAANSIENDDNRQPLTTFQLKMIVKDNLWQMTN